MSSQKGNLSRSRRQKHQNVTAFKNNKYDKSKRTQKINSLEVAEVCKRCQDVIAWKIKYKKYKLLSQPKTCTKCHLKKIKDSYHVVCLDCAKALEICCKCGKKEEIIAHKGPSEKEKLQTMAQLDAEVKALSERKRRAYYRYMDKLKGKKKKKRQLSTTESSTEGGESVEGDEQKKADEDEAAPISMDEYFRNAREKLEELQKKMEEDIFDDFDELDICGSSEEEYSDVEEGEEEEEEEDCDSESDCERKNNS
ncbi:golgin subfamily A member 6-like protein 25 [Palaemon carinicauda]|uniref:golgin subfamily A member 6-like protein 25 n=1 Tax=Palaemon carinicauda TaxID=392227 RepID=UPI0035B6927E